MAIKATDQGRQNLQLAVGGSCVATVSMFRYISRRLVCCVEFDQRCVHALHIEAAREGSVASVQLSVMVRV
jgi:hypothetical protein